MIISSSLSTHGALQGGPQEVVVDCDALRVHQNEEHNTKD